MIAAFLTFAVAVSLAQPAGPPHAPAFNPVQDAPHTVGQPGHLAPEPLPRSPHKRVLPPEKGPGIWAGDEPKAAISSPPMFLGEAIPLPTPEDGARPEVRVCSDLFGFAIAGEPELLTRIRALAHNRRRCIALRRFQECMAEHAGAESHRIAAFALGVIRRECPTPSDDDEQIASAILVAVAKHVTTGEDNGSRH